MEPKWDTIFNEYLLFRELLLTFLGTNVGFQIFDANLSLRYRKNFGKGIGIAEILFRSNIVALCGGGNNPQYDCRKVMFWDQDKDKSVAEINLTSPVINVKLTDQCIITLIETKIMVYRLHDIQFLYSIDTLSNVNGLLTVSHGKRKKLASLCTTMGSVVIRSIAKRNDDKKIVDKDNHVSIFPSGISLLEINYNGTLLAISSIDGCEIVLYDTQRKMLIKRFRRGIHTEVAWSLSFSINDQLISYLTSSGTVHIFATEYIENAHDNNKDINKDIIHSSLPMVDSFAKLYLTEKANLVKNSDVKAFCSFNKMKKEELIIMATNGKLISYGYLEIPNGHGEFSQETFKCTLDTNLENF